MHKEKGLPWLNWCTFPSRPHVIYTTPIVQNPRGAVRTQIHGSFLVDIHIVLVKLLVNHWSFYQNLETQTLVHSCLALLKGHQTWPYFHPSYTQMGWLWISQKQSCQLPICYQSLGGLWETHSTANISNFSDSENAPKNLENMCNYASIFWSWKSRENMRFIQKISAQKNLEKSTGFLSIFWGGELQQWM